MRGPDSPVVRVLRVSLGGWWRDDGVGNGAGDDRGVSHVLGVVLIVGIVLTGIVAIVGFGVTGLSDSTSDLSDTAVERDLAGFAEAVDSATVHSDTAAGTTAADLSLAEITDSREQVRIDGSAGELTLHAQTGGTEQELARTPLGIVEYESPRSGARIAYQSGLVFSAPDGTATPAVVRQNEFTHRTDRGVAGLTLHITRITGQVAIDRQIEIAAGGTEDLHPGILVGTGGGVEADQLVIEVESSYSEGWELALRETFPAERTTFDRDGPELEVVYDVPPAGMMLHAYRHDVELDGR